MVQNRIVLSGALGNTQRVRKVILQEVGVSQSRLAFPEQVPHYIVQIQFPLSALQDGVERTYESVQTTAQSCALGSCREETSSHGLGQAAISCRGRIDGELSCVRRNGMLVVGACLFTRSRRFVLH